MKLAILFLTALTIYNLLGYWRLDYKIGDIRLSKSNKKVKDIIRHKKPKSLSRAKF